MTFAERYQAWLGGAQAEPGLDPGGAGLVAGGAARGDPQDQVRAAVLVEVLAGLGRASGRRLPGSLRLLRFADGCPCPAELAFQPSDWREATSADPLEARVALAHALGRAFDTMLAVEALGAGSGVRVLRRRLGSYFTPASVARSLVSRAWLGSTLVQARETGKVAQLRVCDPAMGAGAFLIEAARSLALEQGGGRQAEEALRQVAGCLHGFDIHELATATAEGALWLLTDTVDWTGRLQTIDALDRRQRAAGDFHWVVGNPPWVAYQGRATQALSPARRHELRANYEAFGGYPTLHGVFVQRATELAPGGVISLLLPSSLSDLDGYRNARCCLRRRHLPLEPLLEYGEDAFEGVVQPCFGLVAEPRRDAQGDTPANAAPFVLEERAQAGDAAASLIVPAALERLRVGPRLPRGCFAEVGFQSNRQVTAQLFLRAEEPQAPYLLPLLEGRVVSSFKLASSRLFMDASPHRLAQVGSHLRSREVYERVDFVVRQTAAYTIAARHDGRVFRNSLLGGFAQGEFDVDLLVGLLNSSLFRAYHVGGQRDARQVTFPQVKVAHLRCLPAPPPTEEKRQRVRAVSASASLEGLTEERRLALNRAVCDLFGLTETEQEAVEHFLRARSPRALVVERVRGAEAVVAGSRSAQQLQPVQASGA